EHPGAGARGRGPAAGPTAVAGSQGAAGSEGDRQRPPGGRNVHGNPILGRPGARGRAAGETSDAGAGPGGLVVTILLCIAGALVGGFIGSHVLGWEDVTGVCLRSVA